MEVLLFDLADTRHGIPVAGVQEIVPVVRPAPLPGAPSIIEGVIDVRGALLPVVDLRSRFGIAPKPLALADHLVIARAGRRVVALRVDRATDLVRIDPAQLEDARAVVPQAARIAGVARLADGLVVIHDLGALLSEAEQLACDRALADAEAR